MTWVRLDDAFATNPKIFMLSDGGFRGYVMGLCYASQHLSDGFVPAGYVKIRAARELEAAGLWRQDGPGWWIHDFLEYNPSRAEVEEERTKKQVAGQAGGKASAQARARRGAAGPGQARMEDVLGEESNPDPTHPDPAVPAEQLSRRERARNPAFDALAELDGGPDGMTDDANRRVGVKLAAITKATPDVTPDEIRRRSALYPLHFPDASLTAAALANNWAKCAAAPTSNGHGSGAARTHDYAEQLRERGQ